MKIKIVKCSYANYWYKDLIGKVLKTAAHTSKCYVVIDSIYVGSVAEDDAVEVNCDTCTREGTLSDPVCCECSSEWSNYRYKGEEKEIEKVVDKKNYIPEICKILVVEMGKDFDIIGKVIGHIPYCPYHFNGNHLVDMQGDCADSLIGSLLNGDYTIEPIVEFAKPIWCKDGDEYKYVTENKEIYETIFEDRTIDYYNRRFVNMFAPDAVIPIKQINKIGDDMRSSDKHE